MRIGGGKDGKGEDRQFIRAVLLFFLPCLFGVLFAFLTPIDSPLSDVTDESIEMVQ